MRLWLPDASATEELGQALAQSRPARAVVHLRGDLGSGKSTLARALLRQLGVTGAIRSPTYTLVERYPIGDGDEALHLDLYRIAEAAELEFLGLDANEGALWLVEWPERGAAVLPNADLEVELAVAAEGRSVRLHSRTDSGRGWLEQLGDNPELRPYSLAD